MKGLIKKNNESLDQIKEKLLIFWTSYHKFVMFAGMITKNWSPTWIFVWNYFKKKFI